MKNKTKEKIELLTGASDFFRLLTYTFIVLGLIGILGLLIWETRTQFLILMISLVLGLASLATSNGLLVKVKDEELNALK